MKCSDKGDNSCFNLKFGNFHISIVVQLYICHPIDYDIAIIIIMNYTDTIYEYIYRMLLILTII